MEDETDEPPQRKYPPSPARMSKTPSWVMLGFVLGVLVGMELPRKESPAPATPAPVEKAEPPPVARPHAPPPLMTIEAVFEEWGRFAVWDNDATEVAQWNSEDHAFSEYYEVRRIDRTLYFRSIPRLTRLVIQRDKVPADCPLQFTVTADQVRDWSNARIQPPPPPPPKTSPNIVRPPVTAPTRPSNTLEVQPAGPPVLPSSVSPTNEDGSNPPAK
jgi:hypothetical protein